MRLTKSVTLIPMILPLAFACAGYSHRGAAKETADAYSPHIDASDFQGPVDNPYFPLIPGTVFKYVEKTRKGGGSSPVRISRVGANPQDEADLSATGAHPGIRARARDRQRAHPV